MILPWKKNDPEKKPVFVASPEKARMWLDRAEKAQSQSTFDVALFYYASAVKLDPQDIAIHDAMYQCAKDFFKAGERPATATEVKPLDGPIPLDRFAVTELYWMRDLNNVERALDMLAAAVKAEQFVFGAWAGPKVFNLLTVSLRDKPSKKMLLRAKDLFVEVNSWEEAKLCIEQALVLDPSDLKLDREFKQILANRAIVASGFDRDDDGKGNFRDNVLDLDKQRAMEEADALTGSAGSEARNLERTKAEYDANPTIPDNIQKYCTCLKRMGTPEHEAIAFRVYLSAFEALKEYRFRMAAGDIKLLRANRQLKTAEAAATVAPTDATTQTTVARVRKAVLDLQVNEFKERAANYPTDRSIKAELGRILFEMGQYEEAMGCLQIAKEEPKMRVSAAFMLGRCFAVSGWHSEAIGEFKDALSAMDVTQSEQMPDIKYAMMLSLIELAKSERSGQHARDAADICSAILRKDISYRDIRQRRKDLDALVKELS